MYDNLTRTNLEFAHREAEKRIEELEKENAELKRRNLNAQDAVTMQMYTNKANKEIADKQLTKATEIIKDCIHILKHSGTALDWKTIINNAEQFLQEIEK